MYSFYKFLSSKFSELLSEKLKLKYKKEIQK